MTAVFVSYRRADAQGWAGRLEADLSAAFGAQARFFDLASIPPGADFLQNIERALDAADAVLVLVGPRWLDLRDEQGARRLDQQQDVVASEVARALERSVLTIPVLLGGAAMPRAETLPERLRRLTRLNAVELSDSRWQHDCGRLLAALEAATGLKRLAAPAAGPAAVRVGAGLQLEDAEVGTITGARGLVPDGGVDVLSNAKLAKVKIDSITGIEASSPAPDA